MEKEQKTKEIKKKANEIDDILEAINMYEKHEDKKEAETNQIIHNKHQTGKIKDGKYTPKEKVYENEIENEKKDQKKSRKTRKLSLSEYSENGKYKKINKSAHKNHKHRFSDSESETGNKKMNYKSKRGTEFRDRERFSSQSESEHNKNQKNELNKKQKKRRRPSFSESISNHSSSPSN